MKFNLSPINPSNVAFALTGVGAMKIGKSNKSDSAQDVNSVNHAQLPLQNKDQYTTAPKNAATTNAAGTSNVQSPINGSVVVNEEQAQQTCADLMSVATTAFEACAYNEDGTLTPEQMEVMMAVMMVAMGKIDREDAESMMKAAEARGKAEAAKMEKMNEICQVLDLVATANQGGCGAQHRLENKLVEMGFPRGMAKSLALQMRLMPPHMQFQFAMMLVKASNHNNEAQGTNNDPHANKANDPDKSPIDSKMFKMLLEGQKEGAEQMMALMLLLLTGNSAQNIQNGAQAVAGQGADASGNPGQVAL